MAVPLRRFLQTMNSLPLNQILLQPQLCIHIIMVWPIKKWLRTVESMERIVVQLLLLQVGKKDSNIFPDSGSFVYLSVLTYW